MEVATRGHTIVKRIDQGCNKDKEKETFSSQET